MEFLFNVISHLPIKQAYKAAQANQLRRGFVDQGRLRQFRLKLIISKIRQTAIAAVRRSIMFCSCRL